MPVTAPVGTDVTMLVPLQLVGMACTPPNVTVLVPCVVPKFAPLIVTAVPTTPELGLKLVMLGVPVITVKLKPLLAWPPTITTTLPVTAPVGTDVTMLVPFQLVGVDCTPANVTVLVPCVPPKFAPEIVTCVFTAPEPGATLLRFGVTDGLTGGLGAPGAAVNAHEVRAIDKASVSNRTSSEPHWLVLEERLPRGCSPTGGPK